MVNIFLNNKPISNPINRYINVGHYAIRIVWEDGHNAGIFSFVFLKSLDVQK